MVNIIYIYVCVRDAILVWRLRIFMGKNTDHSDCNHDTGDIAGEGRYIQAKLRLITFRTMFE